MTYQLEVCVDNLESLQNAISGGATRIELCSSLALGGLTPSYGLMKKAAQLSPVPVYAMIRPRQGDFLYSSDDIESMLEDIYAAKQTGLAGVVFGVLQEDGSLDMEAGQALMRAASGLGTTYHRAIDQCSDFQLAIENIAQLGCERILTSGLACSAPEGAAVIAQMVRLAGQRFSVMAGAGISAENITAIIQATGVTELHMSGKSTRPSQMTHLPTSSKMGAAHINDFLIPVTDREQIRKAALILNSIC